MLARRKVEDLMIEALRRKQMEQLAGLPETLPSGETVNQAVMRAAPMIEETRPRVASPLTRLSDIPVTDTLPAPVEGLSNPMVSRALTRPQRASSAVEPEVMPRDFQPGPLERRLSAVVAPGTAVLNEPAPPMVELGQRPVRRNTGDLLQDEIAYQDQLHRYKPKNHNSRWAGLGLGLLRGFASGGLGGAVFGGIRGLVDKSADEKDARLENLARSGQVVGQDLQRRKVLSDLEADQTTNLYRRAQTQRLLNPQWKIQKDAQGRILRVDPATGETQIVHNVRKTEHPKLQWVDENLMVAEEGGILSPAIDKRTGLPVTSKQKTPVAVEIDGQTIEMTPNAAGMAIATGQRTKVEQENRQADRAAEIERREQERYEKEDQAFREAETFNADLNRRIEAKKVEQQKNEAAASDPKLPYQERDAARARANALRDDIGQMEGQRKSAKRPTPPRPAPQQQTYNPPRKATSGDPWKEYVDTYFNGDEAKAREYQNRRR